LTIKPEALWQQAGTRNRREDGQRVLSGKPTHEGYNSLLGNRAAEVLVTSNIAG